MLDIKPTFNALRRSKAGALMLLIQIAITTAIVSNAAFIINDRVQYLNQETGYVEEDIFRVGLLTFGSGVDLSQQFEADEEMIRNLPGVESAAMVNHMPLSGSGSATVYGVNPSGQDGMRIRASRFVSDEYAIDTLGLSISEGRNFSSEERVLGDVEPNTPSVAIVSRSFIEQIYPDGDGLGKVIYDGNAPLKIVGIVDTMMGPWLRDAQAANVVISPTIRASANQNILVRTKPGERAAVMREIEENLLSAYNKRVIYGVQGMDVAKAEYNAQDLLMLRMLVSLIVVLVLVTALGIFGLTVFNINKRTKQIGTRRALGARKSSIVKYFLVENSMISVIGVSFGAVAAFYLGKLLLMHYSLPELDLSYVLGTTVFVMVISLLSVVFPASRAANISPSIATRSV